MRHAYFQGARRIPMRARCQLPGPARKGCLPLPSHHRPSEPTKDYSQRPCPPGLACGVHVVSRTTWSVASGLLKCLRARFRAFDLALMALVRPPLGGAGGSRAEASIDSTDSTARPWTGTARRCGWTEVTPRKRRPTSQCRTPDWRCQWRVAFAPDLSRGRSRESPLCKASRRRANRIRRRLRTGPSKVGQVRGSAKLDLKSVSRRR